MTRHNPRSCASCRTQAYKKDLIRITKNPDGIAILDVTGKLPGRGAYLCPDSECIGKAKKSGVIAKSLKAKINDSLWDEIENFIKDKNVNVNLKIRSVLGIARRSGNLIIGTDNIKNIVKEKKLLILIADDANDKTKTKNFALEHENIILPLNLNSEELSIAIGINGKAQIVALPLKSGFAKKILSLKNLNIFK